MRTTNLSTISRRLEGRSSACMLTHPVLDRPAILDMTKEEYEGRKRQSPLCYGELSSLAQEIQDYYFSVANSHLGHLTVKNMTPSGSIQSIERNNGANWVGLAKYSTYEDCPPTVVLSYSHLVGDAQYGVLTETIPHEVAHLVWNLLRVDLTYEDQVNLGFRTRTGRYSSHGKVWKDIFKKITGWKKINNRYFGQVTR